MNARAMQVIYEADEVTRLESALHPWERLVVAEDTTVSADADDSVIIRGGDAESRLEGLSLEEVRAFLTAIHGRSVAEASHLLSPELAPETFSAIVHKDKAFDYGRRMTQKLRELIPRQLFDVPIQASVSGRIIDKDDGFPDYVTAVEVTDVPPAITAPPPQAGVEGTTGTFNLGSLVDSGSDGPWSVTVSWGDGGASSFATNQPGPLAGSHAYADNGSYTVSVSVRDADNVTSTPVTFAAGIANVAVGLQRGGTGACGLTVKLHSVVATAGLFEGGDDLAHQVSFGLEDEGLPVVGMLILEIGDDLVDQVGLVVSAGLLSPDALDATLDGGLLELMGFGRVGLRVATGI